MTAGFMSRASRRMALPLAEVVKTGGGGAHPELRFGQGFVMPIRRSMEKSSCKQLARQVLFRGVWAEKDVCTQTFVPRFPQPCGSSFKGARSPGASPVAFLQDNEQVGAGGWAQVHQPPQQNQR